MKRFTALLVALAATVCLMSTALTASADNGNNEATHGAAGSNTFDIYGEYAAAPSGTVISVNVSWEELSFKFSVPGDGVWNPADHTFSGGVSEDGWESTKKKITVENHSNSPLGAKFDFTPTTQGTDLAGKFYKDDQSTELTGKQYIDTAAGTDRNAPPKLDVYFGMTGGAITQNAHIGTIELSISSECTASTEQELKDAIKNNAAKILLTNDITLSEPLTIRNKGSNTNHITITSTRKAIKGQIIVDKSCVEFSNVNITYTSFGASVSPTSPEGMAAIWAKNGSSVQLSDVQIDLSADTTAFSILAQGSDLSFGGIIELKASYTVNESDYFTFFIKDGTATFDHNANANIIGRIVISGSAQLKFVSIVSLALNDLRYNPQGDVIDASNITNYETGVTVYTPTNP